MKIAAPILALLLSTFAQSSQALDEGTAAVEALGRLNGIALACQQPASYLDQGKGGKCPDAATLASKMTAAEKQMQESFAKLK